MKPAHFAFPISQMPNAPTGIQVVSELCPLDLDKKAMFARAGFQLPLTLARAVESRREEFLAGRYCAREAMVRMSGPESLGDRSLCKIDIGPERAPVWPVSYVGSIAHSHGRVAAAVAPASDFRGIGIDFEPVMRNEQANEVRSRILTPQDEAITQVLNGWSEAERVTLAFVAKEAIYKALRRLCGEYFGFEDAALSSLMTSDLNPPPQWDTARGEFAFELLRDIGGDFHAGWQGSGGFVRERSSDGQTWIYCAVVLTV